IGQLFCTLPPDWGKVTPRKLSIPSGLSPGTMPTGITANVWETPTVGYVRDTAETLTESPCL
ncbi:MAG: hypothetical protein DSM106950_29450, partial [Stigonema ocellatum SAG 48.90 = DSM 106950]|nr:hypothetical protein [Stigonema ocellatum SAG 48.90 = DSM 106950]